MTLVRNQADVSVSIIDCASLLCT